MKNKLEQSIEIALNAHAGLTDKAGAPYILHSLRVMFKMQNELEMITAVLHDAVEDSLLTIKDLESYNLPHESIAALSDLTKTDEMNYEQYIDNLKKNPLALKVKIADLEDNMNISRLNKITSEDEKRFKKYHKVYKELKLLYETK